MADNTVGDVVPRAGRDVIEPHGLAQGLDAHHAQLRRAAHSLSRDVALARNRGAGQMKKAQVLAQPAEEAHNVDTFGVLMLLMLGGRSETEGAQRIADPVDDLKVSVGNAKNPATVAA